jgi:acyl carrier protein
MTGSGAGRPGRPGLTVAGLATLLREVTGEDAAWADRVTAEARLEEDLRLDSLELAALDAALRRRYGPGVDLTGYVAGLTLDEIIGLRVGDLLGYLSRCP